MSKRLFAYPDSAQDEAESVRELLRTKQMEFYETPASRWGFSNAAIWLKNDDDFEKAQELMRQHQEDYAEKARKKYHQETGYNANAPFWEKTVFTFKHLLLRRKRGLLLVIVGFILLYYYFYLFFSLFISRASVVS